MSENVVRITGNRLCEMVRERVDEAANELSVNAKKQNIDNAVDVSKKPESGYNYIKAFGIVTAENADSQEQPCSVNNKDTSTLADSLKSSHYAFVRQKGHFGDNDEWSYYIFNIAPATLMYYAGLYNQTSFIYGEIQGNEVISSYYEKQDTEAPYHRKRNPYILKDTAKGYMDAAHAEDYSETGNKYRYSIPFSTLESMSNKIGENLMVIKEDKRDFEINFAMNGVGMAPYYHRKAIYKGLYQI